MTFFIISFIAGILTVLAPCVLPLLPVIIGGSVSNSRKSRPFIVAASLSVSIVVFTLVLKVSTAFIDIPPSLWKWISGLIIIFFGLTMLNPELWEKLSLKFNLIVGRKSNKLLADGVKEESVKGDILIGAALGPVFSTCSPTYFVILATVLPESFLKGLVYLIAYTLGLSLMLLLISVLGQKLVGRLEGASNPHGKLKKVLGVLFVLVGVFIISGLDKKLQTFVVSNGVFDITKIEQKLLDDEPKLSPKTESVDNVETDINIENKKLNISNIKTNSDIETIVAAKKKKFSRYVEIKDPAGFVNSEPFKMSDQVGKKVILLDIMTYSCINCQRTFPYLKTWFETYEKNGFIIVGIHTPEFAFEKKKENVEAAMKQFGLKFPVVLDNDYGTWNALGNNVWPRKYLIDIDGFVVYDHKGEGAYEEIEKKIQELLKERAQRLGLEVGSRDIEASKIQAGTNFARSPETYFGALRNEYLKNGTRGKVGVQKFAAGDSKDMEYNELFLGGMWDIQPEFAKAKENAIAFYRFSAAKVFVVASAPQGGKLKFTIDQNGTITEKSIDIKDAKLYTLLDGEAQTEGLLKLEPSEGVELYAFTFG